MFDRQEAIPNRAEGRQTAPIAGLLNMQLVPKEASQVLASKLADYQASLNVVSQEKRELVGCQQNLYRLTLARARERVARHQASGVRGFREELR
jgi:hypothetical protein